MKILITSSIFPPEIGGPATYAHEFSKRASSAGHEVAIITLSDGAAEELESVELEQISRSKNKLSRFGSLLMRIRKKAADCDVIYAQNPAAIGLPSVLAGRISKKPVVVKYVGDSAWEKAFREGKTKKMLEDFLKKPDANRNIIRVQDFVFRKAAKIITPSKFLKHILVEYYNVPAGKVTVISNAVELKSKGVKSKEKKIITVARLVPWKGVQNVLDIMPELLKKEPNLVYEIVGDGPYKQSLEQKAKELGIEKSVVFSGSLSHEETQKRIASSQLFILDSLYEGLPHVLIESMALGTAVAASDCCGNPELIEDGVNGLLFKPHDKKSMLQAAEKILSDKALRERFKKESKKRALHYNWDSLMKETLAELGSLAQRKVE